MAFEGEDRKTFRSQIPSLRPNIIANEMLLQFAEAQAGPFLDTVVDSAVALNPAAVERRLIALWQLDAGSEQRA